MLDVLYLEVVLLMVKKAIGYETFGGLLGSSGKKDMNIDTSFWSTLDVRLVRHNVNVVSSF